MATSIELFEHSKENIMPVKGGRSGAALSKIFSSKPVESNIEQQRLEIQKKIESTANEEDPLAAWIEYFEWAKNTFPNSRVELLKVIQACTKLFRDNESLKQDKRYLRFWIYYADMLSNPIEMFDYLLNKEIGTDHAVFYEARALNYENFGRYKDAEEAFKLGIYRNVEPLEQLKTNYGRFRNRMLDRVALLQQRKLERQESSGSEEAPRSSRNPALTQLSSRSGSSRISQQASNIPQSNARSVISVLVDENNTPAAPSGSKFELKVQWNEFATEEQSSKENVRFAVGWTGQTLPQKKKTTKVKAAFSIYVDPEADESSGQTQTGPTEDDDDDEEYMKMIQALKNRHKAK